MDIVQLIAGFILITSLLVLAGRQRAIFECVLIYDSAQLWFGERFSKKAFTDASKDTNFDGKVSYLERTFPKDGGHRAKLKEVIYSALAAASMVITFWLALRATINHDNWLTDAFLYAVGYRIILLIVLAAFWFLVYSYSFVVFHAKYRKPPKTLKDFVAYDPPTLPID